MKCSSHNEEAFVPYKMDFYIDRSLRSDFMNIADQCINGKLVLWDVHCFDIKGYKGNFFRHKFDGIDAMTKQEYLFAMDYLTYVLTAYKKTKKEIYKNAFQSIIKQFHEYLQTNGPVYNDLSIYAQTLLFIKAIDVLGYLVCQNDFFDLLKKYAEWLLDENNYVSDNNHGMFQNLALLHLGVLFERCPEAALWKRCATGRIERLFESTYYTDYTNNENSMTYFRFNNYLYEQAIQFCRYYSITGIKQVENKLEKSKEAFNTFAHEDGSLPLIGDGSIVKSVKSNRNSHLFTNMGTAVLKVNKVYMSFKCKTVFQPHAHTDVSSITARYRNIDFLIDTGQYNYNRYTPTNRYMRSSAGHSGIFPAFADNLFQKEFCDLMKYSDITAFEYNETSVFTRGEYCLRDVYVQREISVFTDEIKIKDSWRCEKPTVMRQRFIIPKELIENSIFMVSQRTLESEINNIKFKFEITSDLQDILTTVQFGIAAPQYNNYEETMLLDTFANNTLTGEITARITIREDD